MSKHQSQWETFYLQTLFNPLCTILKKELLLLPFFGWGLRVMEPIAIDRSSKRGALRTVQKTGLLRLQAGRSVLVFPEGTRTPPGEKQPYARSGAHLAMAAGVPILPVAHNAGLRWPPGKLLKYPGTVTVVIGEPIETVDLGNLQDEKLLTAKVEAWIESQSADLLAASDR
jgi:1-acyl-sn-glycerol-3-phosphate acyltransferase